MSLLGKMSNFVKSWGKRPMLISAQFTTDGSGVATLTDDFSDDLTVTKSTNDYTLSFKPWTTTHAVHVTHDNTAQTYDAIVIDPAAGTIEVQFDGAFNSSTCSVTIHVDV